MLGGLAAAAAAAAPAAIPPLTSAQRKQEERFACIALKREDHTNVYIAERLGINRNTVAAILHRYKTTGSPASGSRSGRPRCTDEALDTAIAGYSRTDPFASPRAVKRKLELDVSRITVSRRLDEAGLHGRVAQKKRRHSERESKSRLSFAEGYRDMDWSKVLFSDEKCFYGDGFCGRTWVRRPDGEAFNPEYTVHKTAHPVKVNVWACFAASGQGFIHIFNDNLDGATMKRILTANLIPSAEKLFNLPEQWYFLHDNDKKFHSKVVQEWLHGVGVSCIDFPPYSPDLNPIENLWAALAREVEKTPCNDVEQLQDVAAAAWENASKPLMAELVASMPRRIAAVIRAAGSHTKP